MNYYHTEKHNSFWVYVTSPRYSVIIVIALVDFFLLSVASLNMQQFPCTHTAFKILTIGFQYNIPIYIACFL